MDAGRPEVESKEQAMRLAPDGLDETWILQGFPDDLSLEGYFSLVHGVGLSMTIYILHMFSGIVV